MAAGGKRKPRRRRATNKQLPKKILTCSTKVYVDFVADSY